MYIGTYSIIATIYIKPIEYSSSIALASIYSAQAPIDLQAVEP